MVADRYWPRAVEMAAEFPHAEVRGFDIIPPTVPEREIPPNCTFEVDNADEDLSHLSNMYDFVHSRCVEYGLRDCRKFTYSIARTLRPGGLISIVNASMVSTLIYSLLFQLTLLCC